MNPKTKARWIEALRSGKYRQGRGKLRGPYNEYCCLGVLYDITRKKDWLPPNPKDPTPAPGFRTRNHDPHFLSPSRLSSKIQHHLAAMNDQGASFKDIADWIENHKGDFKENRIF